MAALIVRIVWLLPFELKFQFILTLLLKWLAFLFSFFPREYGLQMHKPRGIRWRYNYFVGLAALSIGKTPTDRIQLFPVWFYMKSIEFRWKRRIHLKYIKFNECILFLFFYCIKHFQSIWIIDLIVFIVSMSFKIRKVFNKNILCYGFLALIWRNIIFTFIHVESIKLLLCLFALVQIAVISRWLCKRSFMFGSLLLEIENILLFYELIVDFSSLTWIS